MYLPIHHREDDRARQFGLIRERPLGLLVTSGPGGLIANLIPFLLDESRGENGTLIAHMARANPQWCEADGVREALVVFQDIDTYITPSWYATKRETGMVVPTWNYAIVQAYGSFRAIEDAAWLRDQIEQLTQRHESARAEPWHVSDAPENFVEKQVRAIVGIEIPITRIDGKWKVSQNRPAADREGVVAGLREQGDAESLRMADMVVRAKNP
jgi:transcriptional regulator